MPDTTLTLIEIDNSQELASTLGAASFDLLLGEFERRVGQLARPGDEIICIQPDKLAVALRGVYDPLQIELVGARLSRLFDPAFEITGENVKATIRAALVPPGDGESDRATRLAHAELGLAEARRTNRRFLVVADAEEKIPDAAKCLRAREVEVAFERGELTMYYQPQVDARSGNIVGAEALMRWCDPSIGIRDPFEFLPYVESRPIMRSITWFAIKSAIAQAAKWPSELTVSLNIAPPTLKEEDLLYTVKDALAIFGLAPERLTLEITEAAMIEDTEQVFEVLKSLRDAGVRVSVDDFGTGCSSLAYFRDFPADELKVDRTFVTYMTARKADHHIVKSIIDLAHNFELDVVAEGVENENTVVALRKLGVDRLQGFWISKPLLLHEFVAAF